MPDEVTVEEAPEVEATDDHAEQNVTVVVADAQPAEPAIDHCEHCEEHAARLSAIEAALAAWEAELQEVEEHIEEAAPVVGAESAETETVIGEQAVEAPAASEEPPAAPIATERHAGFWV